MLSIRIFLCMVTFLVTIASSSYHVTRSILTVDRITFHTTNTPEHVLAVFNVTVGQGTASVQPLCKVAPTYEDCIADWAEAALPYGLLFFLEYNWTQWFQVLSPGVPIKQSIRYVLGNPHTMMTIWEEIPVFGLYAPRTVLVDQHEDGWVHIAYNKARSYLSSVSNNITGLNLANALDNNIIGNILRNASF